MQIKLVTILTALLHARHHDERNLTPYEYTDSMTALRTLQHALPTDNIRLVTLILQLLTQLRDDGKTITLA